MKGALGQRAPGFSLPRVNGNETVRLAGFKDKVVVLFFFATWAAPAKKGFADLAEVQKRIGEKKMSVIGVSVDDAADASQLSDWVRADAPKAVVVHDRDQAIAQAYQPAKLPILYVIDRSGVIRLIVEGYSAGDAATIEKKVADLTK